MRVQFEDGDEEAAALNRVEQLLELGGLSGLPRRQRSADLELLAGICVRERIW